MKTTKRQNSAQGGLQTVAKALKVLDYVVNSNVAKGVSATEVATALKLDRTATHRLLKTLISGGLLHQTRDVRYVSGPTLLCYGLIATRRVGWLEIVRPIMESIVERTGETVAFSLLLPNGMRMFADQVESPQSVRWTPKIGVMAPLYAGATGKAMLASMPPEEVDRYLSSVSLEALTDATVTNANQLRVEIQHVRELGYAISKAERSLDRWAIAAAITTRKAGVVGAISMSGPISRMKQANFPKYGELVKEAACHLSDLLQLQS